MAETSLTIGLYLLFINALTYVMFWIDKTQAQKGGYRISESSLLWVSAIGGSPAAFVARNYLRHKTRKQPFVTLLFLIAGVHIAALGWLLFT